MRVCLLNDSFPPVIDGVANVVMNYGKILQTEGLADVMVATPRYPDAEYHGYPYQVVPYRSIDTTKIVKGYRAGNPVNIREVYDITEFAPDILHSHCPVSSTILARMVRKAAGAPLVFTYHTKFDVDIAKAIKSKTIQKEAIRSLVSNIEACDEVWVVSQGAGENLKSLGYRGEYRVVSNGVDFPKGKVPFDKVTQVVKNYDLPQGVPVFLFVGRIQTYKGLPLILDALKLLSEKGRDFRMIFVGKGPDEELIKEKAKNLGLYEEKESGACGKCIFTGAVYDREVLRAFNTRADLFLFPSTYDTNGIVVREAAACGLASVLIKGSCAAEGITHDRNGYLIDETPKALCELLDRVSNDLDHLHQVGQNAMDEIYISWEESVHAAYERYGEIIEIKKSGGFKRRNELIEREFWDFTLQLYEDTHNLTRLPRQMYYDMRENAEEFADQVSDHMKMRTAEFTSGVKERIEDFRTDFREGVQEFSQDVKDLWQ